jgi:hypothetical protein
VEIIQALGFGVIERLSVHSGVPCYDPEPRIVQSVKLDCEPQQQPNRSDADLTLKRELEILFQQLGGLRDGFVDIEVRHGLPARLVVERRCEDLQPQSEAQ